MNDQFWIGWDAGDRSEHNARGRILAPGLDETFIAPFDVWNAETYEDQWRDGIDRIVDGPGERSTLVTSLLRGSDGSFGGFQWLMYRDREVVVFRQRLILRETVPDFDPTDPYQTIEPRDPFERVSEWRVPTGMLARFRQRA